MGQSIISTNPISMNKKPSQQREQGDFRKEKAKNDEITEELIDLEQNLPKTQEESKSKGILIFKCLILDVLPT
jgi:hypothetical protein